MYRNRGSIVLHSASTCVENSIFSLVQGSRITHVVMSLFSNGLRAHSSLLYNLNLRQKCKLSQKAESALSEKIFLMNVSSKLSPMRNDSQKLTWVKNLEEDSFRFEGSFFRLTQNVDRECILCYKLPHSQQRWTDTDKSPFQTWTRTRDFVDFGRAFGSVHFRKARTRTNIGNACPLISDSQIF